MAAMVTGQHVVAIGGAQINTDGVKRYVALLSQSGTDDPTAVELENTLGGTVVWTRDTVGVYSGTLAGAFPDPLKTAVIVAGRAGANPAYTTGAEVAPPDAIQLRTVTVSFGNEETIESDDVLQGTVIDIRVYP